MALSHTLHVFFRGKIVNIDEEEIDFGDFDGRVASLQKDIDKIEQNRDPELETEYLGDSFDVELKFKCTTIWMDRDSDIEEYLDKVQAEIENNLDVIVAEREKLGYTIKR